MLTLQVMPLGRSLPFIDPQWTGSWVKRKYRLTRSSDFNRVRETGKVYSHPFLVLKVLPNQENQLRIGIAAGKAVGGAVDRNRAKRRMRAVMDALIPQMISGWDIVLIARKPVVTAKYGDLLEVVNGLLTKANLIVNSGSRDD